MSKVKLLLASMLLVFALGAIAAASASAEEEKPEFVIEGLKEGETEKLSEESREDIKPLVLEAEGEPTIECKKGKVVGETVKDDSTEDAKATSKHAKTIRNQPAHYQKLKPKNSRSYSKTAQHRRHARKIQAKKRRSDR